MQVKFLIPILARHDVNIAGKHTRIIDIIHIDTYIHRESNIKLDIKTNISFIGGELK